MGVIGVTDVIGQTVMCNRYHRWQWRVMGVIGVIYVIEQTVMCNRCHRCQWHIMGVVGVTDVIGQTVMCNRCHRWQWCVMGVIGVIGHILLSLSCRHSSKHWRTKRILQLISANDSELSDKTSSQKSAVSHLCLATDYLQSISPISATFIQLTVYRSNFCSMNSSDSLSVKFLQHEFKWQPFSQISATLIQLSLSVKFQQN